MSQNFSTKSPLTTIASNNNSKLRSPSVLSEKRDAANDAYALFTRSDHSQNSSPIMNVQRTNGTMQTCASSKLPVAVSGCSVLASNSPVGTKCRLIQKSTTEPEQILQNASAPSQVQQNEVTSRIPHLKLTTRAVPIAVKSDDRGESSTRSEANDRIHRSRLPVRAAGPRSTPECLPPRSVPEEVVHIWFLSKLSPSILSERKISISNRFF